MAEEFEGRDLSDSVFWGVELRRATFRDVDLSGASISHALLHDVDIDAKIDRLVVNGVDVTDYVNERDRWYPLRAMVRPADPEGARAAWAALERTWAATIARAGSLTDAQRHERVDGEWSFAETLRHLVHASDIWLGKGALGWDTAAFHPLGLGHGTSSTDIPPYDEVLAARAERVTTMRGFLAGVTEAELDEERRNPHDPEQPETVRSCVQVVMEESWEHLRFALRDLDAIEART